MISGRAALFFFSEEVVATEAPTDAPPKEPSASESSASSSLNSEATDPTELRLDFFLAGVDVDPVESLAAFDPLAPFDLVDTIVCDQ